MRTLPTTGSVPQPTAPPRAGGARSTVGRPIRRIAALVLVLLGIAVLVAPVFAPVFGAGEAAAQTSVPATAPGSAPKTVAYVAKVDGFIDPVLAAFMSRTITDANANHAVGLVFQVDLQGSVIPRSQLFDLVYQMSTSPTPIHLWIGPTGSELKGAAVALLYGAHKVSMAPGTQMGDLPPADDPASLVIATASSPVPVPSPPHEFRTDIPSKVLHDRILDAKAAEDAKVATFSPIIGEFLLSIPGFESRQTTVAGKASLEPVTQVVFSQLSLLDSFMHSAASPAVAYLMLTVGLALLIFELFTAGVGVAGVLGAGSLVLGCYGMAVLPTHWWGLAAIVVAMLAFAVDVQTGVPRFWTGAGMVLYVFGSFTMYDGVSMSWLTIAFGVVGVALTFLAGMPSMVRTRFSTPTIGREWMIGEMGRAVTAISPDGVVQIQGAQWRAYTNRATPIEELDKVRVVGIEGLVLEVEPEEGAARDYRERGAKGADDDAAPVSTGDT